jgi:fibronectin-binding autotransporter adhesin
METTTTHKSIFRAFNLNFNSQWFLRLFFICLTLVFSLYASAQSTTVTTGNWNVPAVWGGTVPPAGNNAVIANNVSITSNVIINDLTINAGATLTMTGAFTLTVNGSLTVNGTFAGGAGTGTIAVAGNTSLNGTGAINLVSGSFTTTGTTTLNGTSSINDATTAGTNTFTGLLTINSGTSFTNTANAPPYVFGGGITNNGTFNKVGTGAVALNGANAIGGTSALNIPGTVTITGNKTMDNTAGLTFPGNVTIAAATTFTNNGTVSITGTLNGGNATTSIWVNAANSTLNYANTAAPMATGVLTASASPNTVNYSTGGQTIEGADYHTLTLGGSTVTKTLNGATTVANAFTIPSTITLANSTFALTLPNTTINGALTLGAGNFTASGTIANNGTFSDASATGTNTITGAFTNSGTFSTTNNPSFTFQNGLINNGTMTATGTGTYTFSTNTQTVTGTNAITFAGPVVVASAVTFNNSATYSFSSTFTTNVGGSATFAGTGATTITGATVLNGNFTLNAGVPITHSGAVTIGAGTNYQANGIPSIVGALTGLNATTSIFTLGAGLTLTYSNPAAPMVGGVLDASAAGTTVNYARNGDQTIAGGIYNNLVLSGTSGIKTLGGNTTVNNALTIPAVNTLALAGFDFTALTTISNSGTFNDAAAAGINIITGLFTNTGTFSASNNPSFEFRGGLTNNGTMTGTSGGTYSFTTNPQTITGSNAITFVGPVVVSSDVTFNNTATYTFSSTFTNTGIVNFTNTGAVVFTGIATINEAFTGAAGKTLTHNNAVTIGANTTYTCNGTSTISGVLSGASANAIFSLGTTGTLNYSNATAPMATGQFDLSATGNTVNYTGGSQAVQSATYYNIGFSGAGTKNIPDISVLGNFVRTAGTLSFAANSVTVFKGGDNATANFTNASISFQNLVIDKFLSASVTIVPGGAVTTSCISLSIPNGTLNLGTTATTFNVTGDFTGAGGFNMSGGTHIVNLTGVNNSIGTLTSAGPALGTIVYNRAGNQNMIASPNYRNVTLSGSGTKNLSGAMTVNGALNLSTNLFLNLGGSDLTLTPTATLAGTFSASRMILTDGTGNFIKQGTTNAHFTTNIPAGLYPLGGVGGLYTPFTISSLSATYTGTAAISVRAVPLRQPNVPYFNNALSKYWKIETTNISGISANASFVYMPSEAPLPIGLYEPRVWNGTSLAAVAGPSAAGANPFSTTATTFLAGEWTAVDPTIRTTLYSYQSGDWSDLNTWTTDPSGSTLISSIIPGAGDQVVILSGRTVNTAVARTIGQIEIEDGGILDLGTTTGHNLGTVSGEGRLRLQTTTFPTGNFAAFSAATGGTVEYYNLPGGPGNVLSNTQLVYNNLEFTNSTGTNYTVNTNSDLTINGNYLSNRTSGDIIVNIGNLATSWSLVFNKNVTINAGTTLKAANYNATHDVTIHGNLSVDGTLNFTNGAANVNSTTGAITVLFRGAVANTTATFGAGSSVKFYDFTVTKNDGFELFVSSSPSATVLFHGRGDVLTVTVGTLRLGANLTIPALGDGVGNYDLGAPGVLPVLWIDGANVTCTASGAIVPYGTFKISSGSFTFTVGQAAVVVRESGLFQIDGGTVNMNLFRTSTTAVTHRGSFVMNGGTLSLSGSTSSEMNFYAILSLPYPENVFKMTGGVINITRVNTGSITVNGGIMIASAPQNFDVTGGTINVNVTGNQNFDITSTAPFYDLNLGRVSAGTGQVRLNTMNWSYDGNPGNTATISGQPLTVLNNLNVNAATALVFNTNGFNLNVGGNFNLSTAATSLTTGANTLTFNGNAAQAFTVNGTITAPGLNNLTINKGSASILTIAGSAATITAAGALNLLNGTLSDNGKTLIVGGNVINSATHSGTGKIVLNGTAIQTVGGTGNGVFQNLEIAGGPAIVSATNTIRINGNLNMATNRIFNIAIYRLMLQATSAITAVPGAFGASRFIATDGFQSDGGIVKPYNSTAAFLFPFGTGANYMPATIQFSSTPTAFGTIDLRPVAAKQLYVTDAPNAITAYWKVRQTGFAGVPANSVNLTFNYGTLPDNLAYIPGYYNYQTIAFTTINDISKVNETTKNISFDNVSYFNGDFTAGTLSAFGVVVPYYSRANGNWNNNNTWSNVGYGGAAAAGIPNASVPVFIGDGTSFFHNVTVTANNTVSGSLIVDAGSTLNLGTTTGHNFGALPYATAGGAGTIRISSAAPVAEFPAGDFGVFFTLDGGTTEYFNSGTSFTLPLITASPTSAQIRSYKNLILTPSVGLSIKMPDRDLEIIQNLSITGNAAGIALLNDASAKTLTVRGNLNITSGILRFPGTFAQAANVEGDIAIGTNGTLDVDNIGSVSNAISLTGNLTTNGVIDLNKASKGNFTFIGNLDKVITGTNGAASASFNNITVNKGVGQTTLLNVDMAGAFIAPSNNWLTLQNGTFRLSKATTLTLTDQPSTSFLLPAEAALSLNHASAIVNVAMADADNAEFILAGKLELLNGTMNIGNTANNRHNDLEYAATETPTLEIRGNSQLNVNGQIRRSVNVLLGSLFYNQQDNSTVLVRGKNPGVAGNFNLNRGKFEITNPGSQFNMSGNALLIVDRGGLPNGIYGDVFIDPSASNITGGEIRVGTSLTAGSEGTFLFNSTVPLWNVTVDGTIAAKTLRLLNNPLIVQKALVIRGSSIFNANSLDVTIGEDLTNENPNSATGLSFGGYQVVSATQVTTLNGTLTNQTITGAAGNLTNFANLVVNNTFASGALNLATNSSIRINNNLSALSGNVNGGTNNITVLGSIINNVDINNTGAGYFISNGTSQQVISGNGLGTFGNFRVNNAAGIETTVPLTISGDVNFVNGIFYINNNLLTLTETATISGTTNESRMFRLNGVLSDGGVKKLYAASPQNFTFPIGITLKYAPVTINATTNTVAGSVTMKPVNVKHPATTDPLDKELTFYWNTSSTGFGPSSVFTHVYNYENSDAANGIEINYRAGRFFNNVWSPQFGIPSTVNATSNTITLTGVNYLNGDYTAGEQSEFDQLMVFYSRNLTLGGNWNDPNAWSTDQILQHAGPAAGTFPTSNTVVIAAGHTIVGNSNNLGSPLATINGTLNLNNTIGHNFGTVSGTGTIRITPTVANQFVFPGGNYTAFITAGGGTFEYSSTTTAALPSQSIYNNILFTGTGSKTMANTDLVVNNDFTVNAGNVSNIFNKNITLTGNFTSLPGTAGFTVGTGTVSMVGGAQTLGGSANFYKLNINGAGVKTFNASVTVSNELQLNNGVIATGSNSVSLNAAATILGGSASSYVNGFLQRFIPLATSSRTFPIGDGAAYTPVNISFTGATNAGGNITVSTSNGDNSSIDPVVLDANKSANRFYTITNTGVAGFTNASVVFNFVNADLDGGANPNDFVVGRYATSVWSYPTVGIKTATSTQTTGLTPAQLSGQYQLAELYVGGIVWNGNISGDWNNTGNWTPPTIPTIADNITIAIGTVAQPSFLTGGNGFCKNITFEAGANMTVPSSKMLTISGNITSVNTSINGSGTVKITSPAAVHSGNTSFFGELSIATGANLTTNNGITIKSGGSLMHGAGTAGAGGNVTGNVKVQRTGTSANAYNYWSSPISNGNVSVLGGNRYFYNPTSATSSSAQGLRQGWLPATGSMTNGRGYIATASGTVTFNGPANNGSINYGPLSLGTFTNFNLIGNPYPSAISASAFVAANPQINGSALYFWDDDGTAGGGWSASDYAVWNNLGFVSGPNSATVFTGNIASGQGFFVDATASTTAQFNNTMRTAVNNAFFEEQAIERLWISVTTAANDYNETLIAFKNDATDDADQQYDALKMRGNENIALYTIIGNNDYAIQALPTLNADKMLPLGIDAPVSGQQTLKLKQIDHIPASAQVILEDTKLGVFQNLRTNPIYVYNFESTTDTDRFRLHFKPAVKLVASTESCASNDGTILINSNSATTWDYSVLNSNGATIASATDFSGNAMLENLAADIYTVNLSNQFGTFVQEAIEIQGGEGVTANVYASANEVEISDAAVSFTATVTGATDITWNFGDGTIVTGILNPVHYYTSPGTYSVSFVASNASCMEMKNIDIRVISEITGIEKTENLVFNVYPNPASDNTVINLNLSEREDVLTVFLIDETGKLIQTEKYEQLDKKASVILPVSNLAAGIYQVLIQGKQFSSAARLTVVH